MLVSREAAEQPIQRTCRKRPRGLVPSVQQAPPTDQASDGEDKQFFSSEQTVCSGVSSRGGDLDFAEHPEIASNKKTISSEESTDEEQGNERGADREEHSQGKQEIPWSPSSWRSFPAAQNPFAAVPEDTMVSVQQRLRRLPPLVSAEEVESLLSHLKDVYARKRFVLQGGDCAEVFGDCRSCVLTGKVRLLLQMSVVLQQATGCKVVRIGRMAGQYGKPRSLSHEVVDGRTVMTYRGDSVNGMDPSERDPQPERLLQAYFHSAATLNFVRSLLSPNSSFLRAPAGSGEAEDSLWELSEQVASRRRQQFQSLLSVLKVSDRSASESASSVVSASASSPSSSSSPPSSQLPSPAPESACPCPAPPSSYPTFLSLLESSDTNSLGCFSSHEAFLLPYEEAMTREYNGKFYDTSGHFLWVGDRTRQLDHAHIQFCQGIRNPIGVKVGPTAKPEEIVEICRTLNPDNIPGKVVLITRLGAARASRLLPPVIKATQAAGVRAVWLCDPMHGNTQVTPEGKKRRCFTDMLKEVLVTFDTHLQCQSHLGGVHLELTGEHVFECIEGSESHGGAGEETFEAFCDPRLNYTQALEMAFEFAQHIQSKSSQTEDLDRSARVGRDAN
ncbi:Class-II DAHP synthetase family protein [Toxoplasma gondii MAS]|uniref:Phospho-2-dehydro-3-deoxyheptonate aldolase n=1 Tax=Toxoplasma gondii MAS TaxID=943118 RepID=A0A086QPD2_TOXGO|nr:Class-II DAHP synthetase family protein [Toxoplasma gondii MAS]